MTDIFDEGAMTLAQFKAFAAIGNTKTYDEIAAGRLRTIKVGRRVLVLKSEAKRWLKSYASSDNEVAA